MYQNTSADIIQLPEKGVWEGCWYHLNQAPFAIGGINVEHSFNVDVAKMYGVHAAILLNNIAFWCEKNAANDVHNHDGHYWTYNSKKAFSELFPYMTARQIDYALKQLIDAGILITGNFNANAYDRTLWYAVTKMGYSILQNCEMERTPVLNGKNTSVEPIPDINSDQKQTDKKLDNKKIYVEIVDYLNSAIGTQYRAETAATKKHIAARLNEGFTVDDFKTVIDKKAAEWRGTEMEKYLRPETLFGTKFESYLNAKVKPIQPTKQKQPGSNIFLELAMEEGAF